MNWTKFKEHLQQPIFFIIWVSLGTVFLLFSWKGLTYQEERQFRKQFSEILNETRSYCPTNREFRTQESNHCR